MGINNAYHIDRRVSNDDTLRSKQRLTNPLQMTSTFAVMDRQQLVVKAHVAILQEVSMTDVKEGVVGCSV